MESLWSLVETAYRSHPGDTPFLQAETQAEITFRQIYQSAQSLAQELSQKGVKEGSVVAGVFPNHFDYGIAFFAAQALGSAFVPIAPLYQPREATLILEDCRPEVLLLWSHLPSQLLRGYEALPSRPLTASFDSVKGVQWFPEPEHRIRGGENQGASVILYTSGTTGVPKGVLLSASNLLSNAESTRIALEVVSIPQESKVFSAVLPFFHSFGLMTGLLLPFYLNARSVLWRSFNPKQFLQDLQRYRVSLLFLVPEMYRVLNKIGEAFVSSSPLLPSLQIAVSGGAALPQEVGSTFERIYGLPIHQGYGLTETSPVLTISKLDEPPIPGCSGQAIKDVDLAIVDSEGRVLPPGEEGELWAAGPNIALGYLNQPALTAERFRLQEVGGKKRRWFRTGDRAFLDPAQRVYICGREDDLIIVNGLNVYPAEIVNVLTCFPGVKEAAVGRAKSERHGQEPVAFVVLEEGAEVKEGDLRAFCVEHLARHKVPGKFIFVKELLKTSLGKVRVKEMLQHYGIELG